MSSDSQRRLIAALLDNAPAGQPVTFPASVVASNGRTVTVDIDDPSIAEPVDARNLLPGDAAQNQRVMVTFSPEGGVFVTEAITAAPLTPYDPVLAGVTIGDGEVAGAWVRDGGGLWFAAGFTLGATSVVTGTIEVSLPFDAQVHASDLWRPTFAVWASDATGAVRYGGVAIVRSANPGYATRIVDSPTNIGWDATPQPFAWAAGYELNISGTYVPVV